jgi:peptidoglycan/LPS O-acetylase OafA/YrhL
VRLTVPFTHGRGVSLESTTVPDYRADIDGLRAIAVLAVVAYHAFPYRLPGGFAGVDVFFVISGFLITRLLLRELTDGTFSLAGFFARRIRRLFPALALVLTACLGAGWLILLASEFSRLGNHTLAASAFVANFAFSSESGYFGVAAEREPLLHLWSLGVEEQYYVVWPVLLMLVWRRRSALPWVIAVLALGSFIGNLYETNRTSTAAFFLPHGRFWELLVGGMAALALRRRDRARSLTPAVQRVAHEGASAAGLCLIVSSFVLLNNARAFPGWWVLLPVTGTTLVALAPQSWINRKVLAHPGLVAIGLISYPLYLWHWPLLSFQSITARGIPHWSAIALKIAAVLVAFVLAALTYRFVEQPLRRPLHPSRRVIGALCGSMGMLGLLGLAIALNRLAARLDTPEVRLVYAAVGNFDYPGAGMNRFSRRGGFSVHPHEPSMRATTLFVGDSHMAHYWPRAQEVSRRNAAAAVPLFAVYESCLPLPLVNRRRPRFACDQFLEFALERARRPEVHTVVFSARWQQLVAAADATEEIYVRADGRSLESQDVERAWAGFSAALRDLSSSGKRVFVIGPSPESPQFDPRNMIRRFALSPPFVSHADVTRQPPPDISATTATLRRIANEAGAVLIDPFEDLCEVDVCRVMDDRGRPVYQDNNHLRPFWAAERAAFIDQTLLPPAR